MVLVVHAVAGALGVHGGPIERPGLAQRDVGNIDHFLDFASALLKG
jgi:hypothetical protein